MLSTRVLEADSSLCRLYSRVDVRSSLSNRRQVDLQFTATIDRRRVTVVCCLLLGFKGRCFPDLHQHMFLISALAIQTQDVMTEDELMSFEVSTLSRGEIDKETSKTI